MQLQNLYDVFVFLLNAIGAWQPIYDLFNGYGAVWLLSLIIYAVEGGILFGVAAVSVLALTYIERKALGDIQLRIGPNVCGPFGTLQPLADAIKLVMKENIRPKNVDFWVWWAAPIVVFVPTFMLLITIPFNEFLVVENLDIGILFIIAVSGITPVGIIMAGWASSNKYSLLGGLRGVAQLISYEVPLILAILAVVVITGSMSLTEIVHSQEGYYLGFIPKWNVFLLPLAAFIFFVCSFAEMGRSPFDIVEAEGEIVAGHTTEYSGMRFAFFYLAEYAHLFITGALVTLLFLGGWNGPLNSMETFGWIIGLGWFLIKTFTVAWMVIWISRGTLPRVRIDQLLTLGWKWLLPLALFNIALAGIIKIIMVGGFF